MEDETLQPGFPVNRPAPLGINADSDMNGLSFSVEQGIFIPQGEDPETSTFVLPDEWEIRTDYL